MSNDESDEYYHLGESDDPDGVDASAFFDKDGHALAGKMFFMPRDKHTGAQVKFTTKIPPTFDGERPWFTYEDELLDWVELTELVPERRGLMAKQRLTGAAEHWKPLLRNDELKKKDGVH